MEKTFNSKRIRTMSPLPDNCSFPEVFPTSPLPGFNHPIADTVCFDQTTHTYYIQNGDKWEKVPRSVSALVSEHFEAFPAGPIASRMVKGRTWPNSPWRSKFIHQLREAIKNISCPTNDRIFHCLQVLASEKLQHGQAIVEARIGWSNDLYHFLRVMATRERPDEPGQVQGYPWDPSTIQMWLLEAMHNLADTPCEHMSSYENLASRGQGGAPIQDVIIAAVKEMWNANGKEKAAAGTAMHRYMELVLNNQPIPENLSEDCTAQWTAVASKLRHGGWEIMATEVPLRSSTVRAAGTADLLLWSTSPERNAATPVGYLPIGIADFKRVLHTTLWERPSKGKGPCVDIKGHKLGKYTIQLSLYAFLLENEYVGETFSHNGQKYIGFKVHGLYLVSMHPDQQEGQLVPISYEKKIAKAILDTAPPLS